MRNKFYLVSIQYGREMEPDCGNCDYCFISNNKDVIVREFMQGLKDELSFNDLIIEDGTMSLDDIKKELIKAIDNQENYFIYFYKDKEAYDNGCELFGYFCTLVERKVK